MKNLFSQTFNSDMHLFNVVCFNLPNNTQPQLYVSERGGGCIMD